MPEVDHARASSLPLSARSPSELPKPAGPGDDHPELRPREKCQLKRPVLIQGKEILDSAGEGSGFDDEHCRKVCAIGAVGSRRSPVYFSRSKVLPRFLAVNSFVRSNEWPRIDETAKSAVSATHGKWHSANKELQLIQ